MKSHVWNEVAAIALVGAVVFVSSLSVAQQKGTSSGRSQSINAQRSTNSPQTAAKKDYSRGGPQEGIRVHGHWSIVIKNPDGRVSSRHEFDNALIGSGSDMLAQLLARTTSAGGWGISVLPSTPGGSSCGGNLPCVVIEAGEATGVISVSSNLTVAYTPNPSRTTLQGSYQATSAGDIAQVSTLLGACPPSLPPSSCPGASNNSGQAGFSSRTLTTPIPVQSGQIVQLTVTFTFS